ncbi:MAG: hypothetical protein U1F77_13620 [Kiritimatiellia bacterium]
MATMTHRTTFALDNVTAQRLKRLASRWKVSQAEVVRRSLEHSESTLKDSTPDPVAMLQDYHARGGLDPERAKQWIAELREDRKRWRASS